ncbi:glycosyltransferase family 4 protein [Pseudoalteromonas neustonica]|uniref:Glycosyltransferase family 4 protein n=1 Tax=Pseudoalteromonas neustonica TaxID=1840331 RepID=A0ABY3FEF6_9GAMM|nr:glycosyltransferase [Pseudoalteromonas neustonica]TVU83842.1 glycosyltransferase family 4 protein [Pseudoalteromonas neustonica]
MKYYYFGTYGCESFDPTASSVAGQIAQEGLVRNWPESFEKIYCYVPNRIFPFSKKLLQLQRNSQSITSLFYLNIPFLKYFSLFISTLLKSLMIKENDKVIIYNCYYPPLLAVCLARKIKKFKVVPVLYDIHIPGETVRNSFFERLQYNLIKNLVPKCDSVVSINRKVIEDFCPKLPHLIVHGGVNNLFAPTAIKAGRIKVGFAGRLDKDNGILELTKVAKSHCSNFDFFIAGDGAYKELVESTSEITFLGSLEHSKCIEFLKSMDVLVCLRLKSEIDTSYFFPSKLYEYLSLGKMVITTDLPIEGVELSSIALVIDDNSDSLAAGLESIRSNLDTTLLTKAANTYIQDKTWFNQAQRIYDFLERKDEKI